MVETPELNKKFNTAGLELIAKEELEAIINLFKNMGASPEKCEQVKNYLLMCLAEVRDARTNHTDVTTDNYSINQNKGTYINNFKDYIKGIRNPDDMISLLKKLKSSGKLTTTKKSSGRIVNLDCLDYKILILDLGNIKANKYNITKRENRTDFTDSNTFETNKLGMMKISNDYSHGKVASKKDIQNILRTLSNKYSLKAGKQGDIHDEDIAFFMLITECYGDFLLKDSVLKCYDNFRGFKEIRKDGTGQIIILIKK